MRWAAESASMRFVSGSDASSSASESWSFFFPPMMRLKKETPFLQLVMRLATVL